MFNFKHVFWSSSCSNKESYDLHFVIWYGLMWLCFIFKCWCCLMNWGIKSWGQVEVSNQNIVALIFLTFSFKSSWYIIAIPRSSRPKVKHFAKLRGKQLYRSLFFYKIAGRLLQKRIAAHVFSCKICEIFKNMFFKEHLWMTDSGYKIFQAFFYTYFRNIWNFWRKIYFCNNQPLFAVGAWLS